MLLTVGGYYYCSPLATAHAILGLDFVVFGLIFFMFILYKRGMVSKEEFYNFVGDASATMTILNIIAFPALLFV